MSADKSTIKGEEKYDDFPSFTEFFVNTPLYSSFKISGLDFFKLNSLLKDGVVIDCFCASCKKEVPFKRLSSVGVAEENLAKISGASVNSLDDLREVHNVEPGTYNTVLKCTRSEHEYTFILHIEVLSEYILSHAASANRFGGSEQVYTSYNLSKIGQNPTLADISYGEVNQFKNILGDEKFRELKTGIGIAAHGVGIGSFVYLRRILEYLFKKAYKDACESDNWDEQKIRKYEKKNGYSEKIKMLSGYVPSFMISHASIYSILSKGIHELTEKQCLQYFDLLKDSIIRILDQQKTKLDEISMDAKLSADLSKVRADLKE